MKEKISYWLTVIIACLLAIVASSCAPVDKSQFLPEDQLFVTRKYVGDFIDYRYTKPQRLNDPPIIWIKTTQDTTYGKISIYGRKCEFIKGDRLYLRRVHLAMGVWGSWVYQLENSLEKPIIYRISEYQFDKKVLIQDWF